MKRILILCLGFLTLTVPACGRSANDLVGTYFVFERGDWQEWLRVEKRGDDYIIREKMRGEWLPEGSKSKLRETTKSGLTTVLGVETDEPMIGLTNDNVAIFAVREGWAIKNFQCKTGYWVATPFGPVDVQKR